MTRRFRAPIALLLCLMGALLLAAPQAGAQEGFVAQIREVSFESGGLTRLVVSLAGPGVESVDLGSGDVTVTENGRPVGDVEVAEFHETGTRAVAVALLMDVSASTRGAPSEAAKQAARSFVLSLPPTVRVALIAFADEARLVQGFTTDRTQLLESISALTLSVGTALHDAVAIAADELTRQFNAQRNIVIFSDGFDVGSQTTLAEAVAAVERADAATTTVLLAGSQLDESSLRALADAEVGGEFVRVSDAAQLQAAFERLAQAITYQWTVTYPASDRESSDLDLGVTVNVGGVTLTDSSVVLNRRGAAGPAPLTPVEEKPLLGLFANNLGLIIGIAAAFIGVLMFLIVILQGPAGKTEERALQRRLRMYSRTERVKEKEKEERSGGALSGSAFGRKAVELVEKLPWSEKFTEKLQKEIDRAAWPLRSSEFILITMGGVLGGGLIGLLLFQRVYWGVMLAVVGGFIPRLLLARRIGKRTTDFLGQLPDTLQLLAGSLQAGYGFMQALDTVAREALPPTSSEFARVLAETRLGLPIERALEDMADRVGGDDFKWVVLAINIQRQVGGNLAQLLITVAETLRERERVRRQIKVLSAEGRLSAVVLIALPFLLFGYMTLVNPEYMGQLTKATIGKILIVVATVLIGVGALWMRKIIKIDV